MAMARIDHSVGGPRSVAMSERLFRVVFLVLLCSEIAPIGSTSIYHRIRQQIVLSRFFSLLESNRPARHNLQYGEITVFAPHDDAFSEAQLHDAHNLVFYHLMWYARRLGELEGATMHPVADQYPPVWVRRGDDGLYANDAKILPDLSDYVANVPEEGNGKSQVLHVVDRVLDPVISRYQSVKSPNAYDFLTGTYQWRLQGLQVDKFVRAVLKHHKEDAYFRGGGNTFFIPVDGYMSDYQEEMLDPEIIDSHIIVGEVLFTRAAPKGVVFEGDSKSLHVLLSFTPHPGGMSVASRTVTGNSKHGRGEVVSEVVLANIPVQNGVVHLIKRPLGVVDKQLTLFPFLPIMTKLSGDPFLNVSYTLGEESGFNRVFEDGSKSFTYLVPRDKAWFDFETHISDAGFLHRFLDKSARVVLARHLVADVRSYTMQDLETLTLANGGREVALPGVFGNVTFAVRKFKGKRYVFWRDQMVGVHGKEYFCTDGVVHVIDKPLLTMMEVNDQISGFMAFFSDTMLRPWLR